MTAPATTRTGEFAAGTGNGVVVDRRGRHHYVHVDPECTAIGHHPVGKYPTEKTARAALPAVRACKTCR